MTPSSSYLPPIHVVLGNQGQGRLPTRIPVFYWSNLLDLVGIWLGGMPDLLSFPCLLCRSEVWLMWTTLQRHLCAKHMASRVCQPWHWWRHHGNPRVQPPMPSDTMERPHQGTIIGEWFGGNSSMTPSHVSSPALWHVLFASGRVAQSRTRWTLGLQRQLQIEMNKVRPWSGKF